MASNPFVDFELPKDEPFVLVKVAPELIDEQWRLGHWRGFEMLTCTICRWDTLDGLEAARAKKASCLRCAPPSPPPSGVLVADARGRERTAD